MSKSIKVIRCKDGWLAKITITKLCKTEDAVNNLAKKEGIKLQPAKAKILKLYGRIINK